MLNRFRLQCITLSYAALTPVRKLSTLSASDRSEFCFIESVAVVAAAAAAVSALSVYASAFTPTPAVIAPVFTSVEAGKNGGQEEDNREGEEDEESKEEDVRLEDLERERDVLAVSAGS